MPTGRQGLNLLRIFSSKSNVDRFDFTTIIQFEKQCRQVDRFEFTTMIQFEKQCPQVDRFEFTTRLTVLKTMSTG